ncbi:hypothetical protein BHQ19_25020 [Mycolicibacterium porcinum]|nr:hypothetical protein BHQ19_25020 [Mycolicibacterium porcinum]
MAFLRGDKALFHPRMLSFIPETPSPAETFSVALDLSRHPLEVELVRFEVRLPSGRTAKVDYIPTRRQLAAGQFAIDGFRSARAGDLYASARVYFADGVCRSDALLASVISRNPDQLVISPRVYLTGSRAGRVEYDWDTAEFHCRAHATITNGSSRTRTFRRCSVRATNGGVNGTLLSEFDFATGPFTVAPGATAYRDIDTRFSRDGEVWRAFNRRWDLTLTFTYRGDSDVTVSDWAVYRPMSTVPINTIKTTDFTSAQKTALSNALTIAREILEAGDITLDAPQFRILRDPADKARFGVIDIGWTKGQHDFGEAFDMYEEISGPEQDRMDVFMPVGFGYTSAVPADKQSIGGFSTVNGPYPKDDNPRKSGCLVKLAETDHEFYGVAIAHEICHYLGLDHVTAQDNLMHEEGGVTGHKLTRSQLRDIRAHGMMKWLAPDI